MTSKIASNGRVLLTGTLDNAVVTYADYPTGYDVDNTMVVAFDIDYGGRYALLDDAKAYIFLTSSKIQLIIPEAVFRGNPFRVLLQKI